MASNLIVNPLNIVDLGDQPSSNPPADAIQLPNLIHWNQQYPNPYDGDYSEDSEYSGSIGESNLDGSYDVYAHNRATKEMNCRSLSIDKFDPSNKDQDFSIWISEFETAVLHGTNPHSPIRHHHFCQKYLPIYLNGDAYFEWKGVQLWLDQVKEVPRRYI